MVREVPITIPYLGDPVISEEWQGACVLIDCTAHRRNRVHPGQAWLYPSDKHFHFLTVSAKVNLDSSHILSFDILRGHNNDEDVLTERHIRAIGDGGYKASANFLKKRLLHPSLQGEFETIRSTIENLFSRFGGFSGAVGRSSVSVGRQVLQLVFLYHLVDNYRLKTSPLCQNDE